MFEDKVRQAKANLEAYKEFISELESGDQVNTLTQQWREELIRYKKIYQRFGKRLENSSSDYSLKDLDSDQLAKWRREFDQVAFSTHVNDVYIATGSNPSHGYAPDILAKLRDIELRYLRQMGEKAGLIDKELSQADPEEETEISLDEANEQFRSIYSMVDAPYFGEIVDDLLQKLTPNQITKFKKTLNSCIRTDGYRFSGKKMTRSGAQQMKLAAEKTLKFIESK